MAKSESLLSLVLERRFGAAWLRRWAELRDDELRWLAIYLADEVARGQRLDPGDPLERLVEHGRRWLPAALRTDRPAPALVALLAPTLLPLSCATTMQAVAR